MEGHSQKTPKDWRHMGSHSLNGAPLLDKPQSTCLEFRIDAKESNQAP